MPLSCARAWVLAPLALLLACSGSPTAASAGATSAARDASADAAPPVYPPTQSQTVSCASLGVAHVDRQTVFDALTGRQWRGAYCEVTGGECTALTLDRTGAYTLTVTGQGTTAREDAGHWNFAAEDEEHGVVCLDGARASAAQGLGATPPGQANLPSAMRFAWSGGTLTFGPYTLAAGATVGGAGSPDALPDVHVPDGYARLRGTWRRASPFDAYMTPDAIAFDGTGTFDASFRGGACATTGTFSWDKDTLWTVTAPNACDQRGGYGQVASSPAVPSFEGALLVLSQAAYLPSAAPADASHFVFDPLGHGLEVHGAFTGALRAGQTTSIALTVTNVDPAIPREIRRIVVSAQPARVVAGGLFTDGARAVLATHDLGTVPLAPGAVYADTVDVTPPAAGDTVALAIELDFGPDPAVQGTHTYLAPIAP